MESQKKRTNAAQAAYELRQQIVNGRFPGGTRLYEVALADELQISRTPVREALFRLVEEGLLERGDGSGFYVRSFSLSDVIDAIELRGVLEGTAVRMAAERGTSDQNMKEIKGIIRAIDDASPFGDAGLDRYSALNSAFHDMMGRLSGSVVLERELARVKSLPFASPSAFVLGNADRSETQTVIAFAQAQHRAIVDAVERREGARAEFLAREHARAARTNLEAFRTDPDAEKIVPGLAFIQD